MFRPRQWPWMFGIHFAVTIVSSLLFMAGKRHDEALICGIIAMIDAVACFAAICDVRERHLR